MVRLLVGTDGQDTSETLLAYLEGAVGENDAVYVVNSLYGGDRTDTDEIAEGEMGLEVLEEGLGDQTSVETHQFVRGNDPVEDLRAAAEEWDADEFVIGIHKRTAVGKVLFGSTAQTLLLDSDRPVRTVPLDS